MASVFCGAAQLPRADLFLAGAVEVQTLPVSQKYCGSFLHVIYSLHACHPHLFKVERVL